MDGAVDNLQEPRLPPVERVHLPIITAVPSSRHDKTMGSFLELCESCGINNILISHLQDLFQFSLALEYALERDEALFHPRAFDEDTISIQRALLADPGVEAPIERAFRISALIYMKTIMKEYPHLTTTSRILVQQLKVSLKEIDEDSVLVPLHLWLFFMGGVVSQGTSERAWFVANLVRMTGAASMLNWEVIKAVLRMVLWVDNIHDRICRTLWDEVEMTRTVLNGQLP